MKISQNIRIKKKNHNGLQSKATIKKVPHYFFIASTLPGWVLAFLTNSSIIADIAAIIGVAICISCIWISIIGKSFEMIRLVRLSAIWLCLLHNSSWLTTSYLHRFTLQIPIEYSLMNVMNGGVTISYYALAIFYISIFCIILSCLGYAKKVTNLEMYIHTLLMSLKRIKPEKISYALLIPLAIEIVLIGTGVIGQRTLVVEGFTEGERPGWLMFYESFLSAQIIFNALLLVLILKNKSQKNNWIDWIIFSISIVVTLFIFFNKGRGPLVFTIIGFGYWFVYYNEFKPKLFKIILIASIVYPILSQVLLFNNFIRSRAAGLEQWRGSAVDVVPLAWERFQESEDLQMNEGERTARNLATRPLVALPLAMCMELPMENKSFMWGKNIVHSFIWALPGPIFPNKADYPIQEGLLYQYFPIGELDTADSLYLSSYNEFGWIGVFIYPLLLLSIWMLALFLLKFYKVSGITVIICIAIFFQLFILGIGENALTGWFVGFRTLTLWIIIDIVTRLFFSKKRRPIQTGLRNRILKNKLR